MKVHDTLRLQVEDLRAIQNAEIDLKSMTVLTGPSGSGKSELLKFTYRLLDSISRYEQIIRTEPYEQMDSIEENLYQIVQSLPSARLKKAIRKPRACRAKPDRQYWSDMFDILHQTYTSEYELNGQKSPGKIHTYNSQHLRSIRDQIGLETDYRKVDFPELLSQIRNYQEKIFRLSEERLSKRPYKYLKQISRDIHYTIHYPHRFQLLQNNRIIARDNAPFVGRVENIRKVYYLSSTRGWHIRSYLEESWFHRGGRTIPDSRSFEQQPEIKEMLETIIGGKISLPDIYQDKKNTRYEWSHHVCERKDGTHIPLRCCGASMNNFLTIYRMLKKGLLDKKTLVVFDQPETYLGSDQIIQVARLACILQKKLGVRFLMATNLQEMIRALENAAAEFQLDRQFNRYESKESEMLYHYSYFPVK